MDLPGSEKQLTPKDWGKWAHADTSRSLKAMAKLDAYKERMSKRMLEGGRVFFAKKLDWKPQVTVSQKDSALARKSLLRAMGYGWDTGEPWPRTREVRVRGPGSGVRGPGSGVRGPGSGVGWNPK